MTKLPSLQNQVINSTIHDELREQNFHEAMKKVFEPVSHTVKGASEDGTETMMVTSKENSKTITNLNEKVLDVLNSRGIIATCIATPLLNFFKPENTSQFKSLNDSTPNKVKKFL